jgi:CRP-like cAMP-binding protein
MSLLLNQPRSATVVAEVTSELVEIFPEALQPLFDSFPDLKARVEQIVAERKKAA